MIMMIWHRGLMSEIYDYDDLAQRTKSLKVYIMLRSP